MMKKFVFKEFVLKEFVKNKIDRFKESFIYNLLSSGLGIVFVIIATLLIIFHDTSCNKKVVKMKEDVLYIKPSE